MNDFEKAAACLVKNLKEEDLLVLYGNLKDSFENSLYEYITEEVERLFLVTRGLTQEQFEWLCFQAQKREKPSQ